MMRVAKQPPVVTIRAINKVVVAIIAGLFILLCRDDGVSPSEMKEHYIELDMNAKCTIPVLINIIL